MAVPAHLLAFPERGDDRAWPVQGEWTYGEYRLLPVDGRRYEVVRGVLYMTPAPSVDHQRALRGLFRALDRFVVEHDLGEVLPAPFDVLLPRGLAAPVQPDLAFFRTGNQPRSGASSFEGVPDLVVEILSPGTRGLDTRVKFEAYREAGVPELWFADPRPRTLVVYALDEERGSYVELCRGGEGETVFSRVLPGLRVAVDEIFSSR